ncbi:MAG: FKBP-type peptidyl-prolyl cis-trans isomerase [Chitinophagaceae bacterium]|nr:MAG: FKBP-type peptidyl-prolyl cis-trans isomerase [Chitinophagaceae bacterium]
MKRLKQFGFVALSTILLVACGNADFKTTSSGLKYKIIEGKDRGKDSVKEGQWLKMNVKQELSGHKDSLLGDTYGKMPAFVKIQAPAPGQPVYGPDEVFKLLRKGDSLVTVLLIDSIISKGLAQEATLPPFMKKGDKITITFKVDEVYANDSLAQADMAAAQKIEEKRQKEELEQKSKEEEAKLEKSGEKAKQIQEVKDYLAKKTITATQAPAGEFVKFDNPGTGAQVTDGKYVTVKYTGKKLLNDSTFESNQFDYQVGVQSFIKGFEDGLRQFKQGGKGSIYIPGYLAYGASEFKPPFLKNHEPLIFDVEIIKVSDEAPKADVMPIAPPAPKK